MMYIFITIQSLLLPKSFVIKTTNGGGGNCVDNTQENSVFLVTQHPEKMLVFNENIYQDGIQHAFRTDQILVNRTMKKRRGTVDKIKEEKDCIGFMS